MWWPLLAASWHFGYGLFLFGAKWGIVSGEMAQKRAQTAGVALSVVLVLIGLITLYSFVAKYPRQERDPEWDQPAEGAAPADQSRVIPQSIPSSQAQ